VIRRDLNLPSQSLTAQDNSRAPEMLFAYIGPETMMPVASVLAGVVGVFMMFGRSVVGFGRGLVRRVPKPKTAEKPEPDSLDEP
jgi:hypothetical protein